MKYLFIKDRKKHLPVLLLWISAVFALVIVIKAAGLGVTYVNGGISVKKAVAQSSIDPNDAKKYFAKSKELAEKIKKKNLFVPPVTKRNPVNQVLGILGSEALINGKWYKAGDKVGDAEIMIIEPTRVKIKWDGKEKFFAPLAAIVKSANTSAKPRAEARKGKEIKKEQVNITPEQAEVRVEPGRRGRGRGKVRFRNLSPEQREEMRAKMRDRR